MLRDRARGTTYTARERLNLWYLSDAGQDVLRAALRTERFRVDVPEEEAALLVVTWLLDHDRHAEALDLVAELRPLMHRLRFSPSFEAAPRPANATVRLRSAGEVAQALRAITVPAPIETMRATLAVWNPLFDRWWRCGARRSTASRRRSCDVPARPTRWSAAGRAGAGRRTGRSGGPVGSPTTAKHGSGTPRRAASTAPRPTSPGCTPRWSAASPTAPR